MPGKKALDSLLGLYNAHADGPLGRDSLARIRTRYLIPMRFHSNAFQWLFLLGLLASAVPTLAQDFDQDEMVAEHNRWRRASGVPPLSYSDDLADSAQEWADHLAENNGCRMMHSHSGGQYGENIYWASPELWSDGRREMQEIGPRTVVGKWGKEGRDYDYRRNRCARGKLCGHYTQVVWKTTREVGCAMSVCEESLGQIWVCRYQPAGNWMGERPY